MSDTSWQTAHCRLYGIGMKRLGMSWIYIYMWSFQILQVQDLKTKAGLFPPQTQGGTCCPKNRAAKHEFPPFVAMIYRRPGPWRAGNISGRWCSFQQRTVPGELLGQWGLHHPQYKPSTAGAAESHWHNNGWWVRNPSQVKLQSLFHIMIYIYTYYILTYSTLIRAI